MYKSILRKIFGTAHEREMKRLQPTVDAINQLEPKFQAMSDVELKSQTALFKARIEQGESVDDLLPEAFAVCREASRRVLGMRHYDVQLIGGMVLHSGAIAEMKTGEGKTLVATLPIYLNALAGKGVHLVTVNDYLARRDAEWMGRLYSFLGMKTGVIIHGQSDREKQEAYAADITYATNNELGFDYLRDNMKFDLADYTQRPLHFAIVDECDSILIDEARTPLIISGPAEDSVDKYLVINKIIPFLKHEQHFTMEEKSRTVSLTEEGNHKCEDLLKIKNLYDPEHIELLHHIYQGLKAHHLYHRDVDYMVKDDEIVIVDEFTGRLMEGRRWSDGLHQAVEAKEGVKVKNENQTLATITFQNYFRMYKKLAGMTGTADTESVEFDKIYKLNVVVIPTNRPVQRMDLEDVVYKHQNAKFEAIVKDITERREKGQPVLVGTVSIERSEILSRFLQRAKIPHTVLNAKYHEREAEIVAQAGRFGAVTIATNMAGRGTDIVLGGNPEALARQKYSDIDSEEYKTAYANFKLQAEEEKAKVIAAGGLYIIGTERHESRRIDNQLRGRSGRQGDPGESRFYLALDDDLMRKFNGERIQKIMTMLNVPDDEPITARMVSNSIEGAQRKVEGHNFDIRKHLLDYDDVMNKQRAAIYGLRREVLESESVEEIIREMLGDVTSNLLDEYANEKSRFDDWNLEGLKVALHQQFGVEISWQESGRLSADQLVQHVKSAVIERLESQRTNLMGFFPQVQKGLLLEAIDQRWKEHLQRIDQLREWINLRAYAQKDPLVEYKQEAFKAFEEMNNLIRSEVIEKLFKIQLAVRQSMQTAHAAQAVSAEDTGKIAGGSESRQGLQQESQAAARPQPAAAAQREQDAAAAAEALQGLRPKARHRLTYSHSGQSSAESSSSSASEADARGGGAGGGDRMSRSERRRLEREEQKRGFKK